MSVVAPPVNHAPAVQASYARLPVVLFAFAVSLLFGLPHLLMWRQLAAQGRPYAALAVEHVTALTYDETTYYAPRLREVYDGRPLTADPAGWEHKPQSAFSGVGLLPPLLLAPLTFLAHGRTDAVFLLCDFLLPPLLLLALLWLCRTLGLPLWPSAAGSLLLLIAHDQITLLLRLLVHPHWSLLSDSLHLGQSYRPVEYSRLPIPQLGYLFVVFALAALYRVATRPRPGAVALAALALGSLFYTYLFYWTYLLAGALLWALFLLAQRRPAAAGAVLAAVAGGCLLGLPVLWQLATPDAYVGKAFLEARQTWGGKTVNFAHHKYEIALWLIVLAVFPWRDRRFPLFVAFLLAPYACVLASRLAHLNAQEWHWFGRCWYPWMALTLPVALWARVQEPCAHGVCRRVRPWVRARLLTPVMAATALGCLAYGFNDHVRYGLAMAPWHTFSPGEAAAYAWLRNNAPRDAVVAAADCNVLALVPVYTQCNVYLPYCLISPASDEELMERFWTLVRLFDLQEAAVQRFLAAERHSPEGFWYPHRWWMINWLFHTRFGELALPPEARAGLEAARRRVSQMPLPALLRRYRLDYLWVDSEMRRYCRVSPDRQPYLRRMHDDSGVALYRVTPVDASR